MIRFLLLFVASIVVSSSLLTAQNVGVGTDAPVEFFSVGASSQFRVNASGNLVRINNVQYSFPAVQATSGSVLANDGSGNLSWTKVTTGNISATGTANNTTFLRGDGSWQTPAGGTSILKQTFNALTVTTAIVNLQGNNLSVGTHIFTITGASVGDPVTVSFEQTTGAVSYFVARAWVSATNQVSVRLESVCCHLDVTGNFYIAVIK